MSLTKKDFVVRANNVRAERIAWGDSPKASEAVESMTAMLTAFCAKQNPRFDRDRFLKACRGE